MELLFDRAYPRPPELTLVLLDWDCRESYHFLDYLARQNVERDRYEVIWIEFYTKRAPELRARIDQALAAGLPPPIDRYVVLDLPKRVCYHKHLMYNVGIALARGGIVCNLDSDAMARPDFVAAILQTFAGGANVVLHLDELRSVEKKFYPFNYPDFAQVEGTQAINSVDGVPAGLLDRKDMLHSRNYGACMAARRSDLIGVGGADMHWNYLGYICGPYDLTFRLLNAGARLQWHAGQWLYHTWHPGQAGDHNYGGPHDGRHMARPAMESRRTGRVMPLLEHPVMGQLRRSSMARTPQTAATARHILEAFAGTTDFEDWDLSRHQMVQKQYTYHGRQALSMWEAAKGK